MNSFAASLHQNHKERKQRFDAAAQRYRDRKMAIHRQVQVEKLTQAIEQTVERSEPIKFPDVQPEYCFSRPTISRVQRVVAERFELTPRDLKSSRRFGGLVKPRMIAVYLSRKLTKRSLPEIGYHFGGRDHTTVMHSINKIEELIAINPEVAKVVEELESQVCA